MALIWTWVHGALDVSEEPDDNWIGLFHALDDGDDCATDGVEIEGRWLDRDEVRQMPEYCALDEASSAARQASIDRWKTLVRVEVRHPKRDRWTVVSAVEPDAVAGVVDQWTARVGPERVKIASR